MIQTNVICKLCGCINDSVNVIEKWFHDKSGFHMQFECIHCKRKSNIPKMKINADGVTVHVTHMGAIQSNSAVIYLSISDGKICRRVQSPTPTSKTRETKDGRTVHEEHFRGWEGLITDIQVRETDYGKEWNVTIEDDGEKAVLQFKYSSGYATSFLKALPNVNLNDRVSLIPQMVEINGKKRSTLFLNQGGTAVKWYFTKDNPNGCPGMKKIKIKGVESWDDSDMMEFLEAYVNENIKPALLNPPF